jgi:hypothetical protein
LVLVLFTFYIQDVLKFKYKTVAKRLRSTIRVCKVWRRGVSPIFKASCGYMITRKIPVSFCPYRGLWLRNQVVVTDPVIKNKWTFLILCKCLVFSAVLIYCSLVSIVSQEACAWIIIVLHNYWKSFREIIMLVTMSVMPLTSRQLHSTEYYRLKFRFLREENFAVVEVTNHSVL